MTPVTLPAHDTLRPITRAEARPLAEAAYRGFADLLGTVGPDDWSRPTDCVGWTVRDLAGHMLGAMRGASSFRELMRQQREISRRHKREGGDETDIMTALQIELTADLDPDAVVRECHDLVVPAAAGRARYPAPMRRLVTFPVLVDGTTETWRLGYLVDVILTRDAWLHTVDLARALAVPVPSNPDLDDRLLADVALEWAARHGRPARLVLSGAGAGTYDFAGDGAGQPEVVSMDGVELARTLSGREPGEGLLASEVPF